LCSAREKKKKKRDDGGGGGGCGGNLNFIEGNSGYEDVNIIYLIQDSGQWLSTVITLI